MGTLTLRPAHKKASRLDASVHPSGWCKRESLHATDSNHGIEPFRIILFLSLDQRGPIVGGLAIKKSRGPRVV